MPDDIVVPALANAKVEHELRTLCRSHHVKRLMAFGSAKSLRRYFRSDVLHKAQVMYAGKE